MLLTRQTPHCMRKDEVDISFYHKSKMLMRIIIVLLKSLAAKIFLIRQSMKACWCCRAEKQRAAGSPEKETHNGGSFGGVKFQPKSQLPTVPVQPIVPTEIVVHGKGITVLYLRFSRILVSTTIPVTDVYQPCLPPEGQRGSTIYLLL